MQAASPSTKFVINWAATTALIFYPLLILALVGVYCFYFGFGKLELILALGSFYISTISVGIGLHRLWSHNAYKTHKWVEFILAIISAGTLQGPVLAWASDHQLHHAYMDTELDPHSPLKYKSKLKGFLWSHIGWMLIGETTRKHISKSTLKTLGRNKILVWQLRYYWYLAIFMNVGMPLIAGYLIGQDVRSAIAGFIFIGLGRALQQQATFCVNSLNHFIGSKDYMAGTPGDNWIGLFFLLGENWHNFHHTFARDYRNGWKWYHLDVHKWIIYGMSKCGLAWDLVVTPPERIAAKQAENNINVSANILTNLKAIEESSYKLAEGARKKLMNAEKSAIIVASNIKDKLSSIENSAQQLADRVSSSLKQIDLNKHKPQLEAILKEASRKFHAIEKIAYNIGVINTRSIS